MKEEEEGLQSAEIANEEEEEEVAENDLGDPTLHCGECNFKVGLVNEIAWILFWLITGVKFFHRSSSQTPVFLIFHYKNREKQTPILI